MNDEEKLRQIYESFNFNISVDDKIFETLVDKYINGVPIWERFEVHPVSPMFTDLPIPLGTFSEYRETIIDKQYITRVAHIVPEKIIKSLQNIPKELLETIKEYSEEYLLTFKFVEGKNNIELSGEMGFSAKLVMDFVVSSIKDAMSRSDKKTFGIYYVVSNHEAKRIRFYDRIISIFSVYKRRYVVAERLQTYIFFV
jgi:hypothetical protein